jgi:hypothetical protein
MMVSVILVACGGGGSSDVGGGQGGSASGGSGSGGGGTQNPPTQPTPTPISTSNPVPAGFESITTLTKQAVANVNYFVQAIKAAVTDEVVITLPSTVAVGDTVRVKGDTDIRWKIAQNAGQTIGSRALPGGVEPGVTFSPQQSPTQNWWFVASSASGQKLAAVANNFVGLQAPGGVVTSGSIWTSADAGATWTERTAPPQAPWSSIASSADGTKLVAVGLGVQIWTSGDSGVTWQGRDSARVWDSVTMSADGSRMAAATLETVSGSGDGKIYTLQQAPGAAFGTGTWIERGETKMWRSIASSADGSKLVAGAYRDDQSVQQGVYTSIDFGVTWTSRLATVSTAYRVASSSDGTKLALAERFGKIYTSADSGLTWSAGVFEGGFNSVASSADGSVLVAVQATGTNPAAEPAAPTGRTGKLLVSSNSGATWTERATPNKWWRGAAVSADGNRLVGAVNVGQIYVSTSNRTTYGTTGSVTGGPTNDLTLRYLGDGLFDVTGTSGPAYLTR